VSRITAARRRSRRLVAHPGSVVPAVLAFVGGRGGRPRRKALALPTGARGVLAIVAIVVAISPILKFRRQRE
jgi:hypothetical protein